MAVVRHQCIAKSLAWFWTYRQAHFSAFCTIACWHTAVKERDLFKKHFHLEDCDPAWWDQEN